MTETAVSREPAEPHATDLPADPSGDAARGSSGPPQLRPAKRRPPVVVWCAIGWLVGITVLSVGATLLPLKPPGQFLSGHVPNEAPGLRWEFLGTDDLGRSTLSRVLYGARLSLGVGVGAALLAMTIGILIGVVAGYFRGALDYVIDLVVNAMLAFPPLILLIGLSLVFKPSIPSITVELAVLAIPNFARIARANAFALRNREFVLASRVMGAGRTRVLGREVIPAVGRSALSYLFVISSTLMVAESSLSFLGLGVPPPNPTWGGMISGGLQSVQRDAKYWYLVFVPAAFFFLTIISLNLIGDWLRQRLGRRMSL